MIYRELPAPAELAAVAANLWEFEVVGELPPVFLHRIPLDGCLSIGVCDPASGPRRVIYIGPRLEPLQVPVHKGDRYRGVRFLPGASRAAIGSSGESLRDLAGLWEHSAAPRLQNEAGSSIEEFGAALVHALETTSPAASVTKAIQLILARHGDITIAELPLHVGLSKRQFERVFKREVGLTPKQFARICRSRAAAREALNPEHAWGEIAARKGFSDQAHLVREFNDLFGITPGEFSESFIRQIAHTTLVHI